MRIAFVIDNLGSGGAQRQVAELAVHLHRDHGIHVEVATYRERIGAPRGVRGPRRGISG